MTVNFFKCYNPTTSAQRLELPTVFSFQLQGALPERAFLRDCYTTLWPIKMAKIDNDCFFCDGWEKFVEDNSLESRDVLVFRYDGDNLFDVKLLGLSGCEKEGPGHFTMSNGDKNKEDGNAEAEQVADDKDIKVVKTRNFFKCYNPKISAQRLELPMAFSLQLQGALPVNALLRDCHANLWPVKMAKIDNDCYFCDGWEKFVRDNSLELGDIFVFRYDGENLFDVKLLGLSGCEKVGLGHFNMSVEDKINEEDGEGKAEKVAGDGASKKDDVESNEDLYYMESEDESEQGIHDRDDNAEVHMEIEEDKDAEDENGEEVDTENNEDETQEDGEEEAEHVAGGGPGQRPLDPYGNDIFNSNLAIRPRNPYFVTKIRKSRPNDLYIPKETIKDFQLNNLPEEMFLIDPQDRQFHVKIIRWKDDRVWYRGGWKSLCAVNFVSKEDTCICEFVGGRLRVQVVGRNN